MVPPSKEGFLFRKRSGLWSSTYEPRFVVLRPGLLYIYKDQSSFKKVNFPEISTEISQKDHPVRIIHLNQDSYVELDPEPLSPDKFAFILSTQNGYKRNFACDTSASLNEWLYAITANTVDLPTHRFSSFAPVREGDQALWLVDGEETFSFVYEAIHAAKEEVFIAGKN